MCCRFKPGQHINSLFLPSGYAQRLGGGGKGTSDLGLEAGNKDFIPGKPRKSSPISQNGNENSQELAWDAQKIFDF